MHIVIVFKTMTMFLNYILSMRSIKIIIVIIILIIIIMIIIIFMGGYFEDLPETQNSHCLVTCYIKTLVVTYGEMILYTLVCFQSYRVRSRKLYTK